MAAIDIIIDQVDRFIRKYYKNQILKGLLGFVGIFISTLLVFALIEYIGWFSSSVRAVLFYVWIGSSGFIFIQFILIPVLKLFQISKGLSRERAASIIGSFFPEVGDKLLNTLQLSEGSRMDGSSVELIEAAIEQRSKSFRLVEFTAAVDDRKTLSYLKYVIPLIILFVGLSIFKPEWVVDPSSRIIQYNHYFEKPAPFQFNLIDFKSDYVEGESIRFRLKMSGEAIPDRIYVHSKKGKEILVLSKDGYYEVDLGRASDNGQFHFEGGEYNSKSYYFAVKKRPSLVTFAANVSYPSCFGKGEETFSNASDLVLPEGSYIQWKGVSKNAHQVDFYLNDSLVVFKDRSIDRKLRVFTNQRGRIFLKDKQGHIYDSLNFGIQVIRDAYPDIYVEEFIDSTNQFQRFFKGRVSDDNGLAQLQFHYTIYSNGQKRTNTLQVKKVSGLNDQFEFGVDFLREKIQVEDKVEYYFTVRDNDCVHGGKTTSSSKFNLRVPSKDELQKNREQVQEQMKNSLASMQSNFLNFQDQLNRMKRDINSAKSMDWKLQNQVKQLMEDYNQLMEEAKQVQKELDQNAKELDKLSKEDQALMEKQKLLNELLNQLMDDELKSLLEKMQQLMQENNKQEMNKTLEEMNKSSEDMNRNLDRSIENLKRMQVDEKIDALENQLKSLVEEQRKLENEIQNKKNIESSDIKKQEDINKQFEEVKEEMKDMLEKNEDLKRPFNLPDLEDKLKDTGDDLKNASDKMEKNNKSQSSKSQKSAAEKMEEMAKQLDQAQQKSKQEQQGEDIDLLRQILKSLVTLSHEQELVMNRFSKLKGSDPNFKVFSKKQVDIIDDFRPVADSLYQLAGRQPKIAKFVDDEIRAITTNHKLSTEDIQERRMSALAMHQQYAMTSFNNLSLMLNESLQQMQKDMQDMQSGEGACDNPGNKGKPKPGMGDSMSKMKEQLKKQLEKMEQGSQEGSKGKDEKGENGELGLGSKEIAKMAAEQAMIRKQLEQLKNELKNGSKGAQGLEDVINQMEKQEEELVNQRFNRDMINRQKNILTRLLESENALEEREWSDERESKEGKNVDPSNLILINQYNIEKLKQIEEIQYVDPKYQRYYKEKAVEFLNR